jgi:hypothetical protein
VRVCDQCHRKILEPPDEKEPAKDGKQPLAKGEEGGGENEPELKRVYEFKTAKKIDSCDVCNNLWEAPGESGFKCEQLGIRVHRGCKNIAEAVSASSELQVVQNDGERWDIANSALGSISVRTIQGGDLGASTDAKATSPYVKFILGPSDGTSKASQTLPKKGGGQNPVWGAAEKNVVDFDLPLRPKQIPWLVVEVWNSNIFSDTLLGRTVVQLSPVLLNPMADLQKWHNIWPLEEFDSLSGGDIPKHSLERDQKLCGMIMLSIRFDPKERVYCGNWQEHKFSPTSGMQIIKPSLCAICGMPILMPLAIGWQSCSQCNSDIHKECLPLVDSRLPCIPKLCRSESLAKHRKKAEDGISVGVLSLHLRSVHCCCPECTDLYHVYSSESIVKSSGSASLVTGTGSPQPSTDLSNGQEVALGRDAIFVRIKFEDHVIASQKMPRSQADVLFDVPVSFLVKNPSSRLLVEVVNEQKVLGEMSLSVFDVVDHMTLLQFGGTPEMYYERGPTEPEGAGMQWHAMKMAGTSEEIALRSDRPPGYIEMRLYWSQDLLKVMDLPIMPLAPPQFSLDELKDNFARFQALFLIADRISAGFDGLFSWQDIPYTATCFLVFLYLCFYFDWSRALLIPIVGLILVILNNYYRRLSGRYQDEWLEYVGEALLGTTTVKLAMGKLSFVPSHEDENEATSALLQTAYVAVYWVENIPGNDTEQLVGMCYPELHIDSEQSDHEGETGKASPGKAETEEAAEGKIVDRKAPGGDGGGESGMWGLGDSFGSMWGDESTSGAPKAAKSAQRTKQIKRGKPVVGKGAKLVDKKKNGSATFEYMVVQGVREESGKEMPLAWDENPGFFLIRVEAKKPKQSKGVDADDGAFDTVIFGEVDVRVADLVQEENLSDKEDLPRDFGNRLLDLEPVRDDADKEAAVQVDLSLLANMQSTTEKGEEDKQQALQERRKMMNEAVRETKAKAEQGPTLGFMEQYRELKAMTRSVQNEVGGVVSMIESAKNICTWAQPQITVFLLYACLAALVIALIIPSWLPITAGGAYMFIDGLVARLFPTKKLRIRKTKKKQKKKQADTDAELDDAAKLLLNIPNDRDLRRIYTQRSDSLRAYTKRKERLEKMNAVWQGLMTVEDKGKTKTRYVVLRKKSMAWFRTLDEAEASRPPLGVVTLDANCLVSDLSAPETAMDSFKFTVAGDMPDGKEVQLIALHKKQKGLLLAEIGNATSHLHIHEPTKEVEMGLFMKEEKALMYKTQKKPKKKAVPKEKRLPKNETKSKDTAAKGEPETDTSNIEEPASEIAQAKPKEVALILDANAEATMLRTSAKSTPDEKGRRVSTVAESLVFNLPIAEAKKKEKKEKKDKHDKKEKKEKKEKGDKKDKKDTECNSLTLVGEKEESGAPLEAEEAASAPPSAA